jgi:hypothetical protein
MNNNPFAQKGISALCPCCSLNTLSHYLHKELVISYCECRQVGGLFIGFSEPPHWKLYTDIDKQEFFSLAQSANMYLNIMKETNIKK